MPTQYDKDQPDDVDRINSSSSEKLSLLCDWGKEKFGVDPRGTPKEFTFVARPEVVAKIWLTLTEMQRDMQRAVVYGKEDADVIYFWCGISMRARSNVKDNNVHLMRMKKLPESTQKDRQAAGEMRMRGHRGWPMIEDGSVLA